MVFDEIEFFDSCDDFDFMSTEELLFRFKRRFKDDFDFDMYDFISSLETRDSVLMLMIIKRFIDFLDREV